MSYNRSRVDDIDDFNDFDDKLCFDSFEAEDTAPITIPPTLGLIFPEPIVTFVLVPLITRLLTVPLNVALPMCVLVPVTVKLPPTVKLPVIVTLLFIVTVGAKILPVREPACNFAYDTMVPSVI